MKLTPLIATLLAFVLAIPARSQDAAATLITICDHAAANPSDHNRPAGVAGVSIEKMNIAAAIAACEAATRGMPKEARVHYQLGRAYEAAKYYDKAHARYTTAHEMGYVAAAKNLGLLYGEGRGIERDFVKARRWYEIAAVGGDRNAMNNLGLLYYSGQGVEQSYVEARRWFEQGAAQGDGSAMYHLGMLHDTGHGVARSYIEARHWFEQGAAKGNPNAMNSLGSLYHNGEGVKRDLSEARRWYEKAIAAGENKHAAKNLRNLRTAKSGGTIAGVSSSSRGGGGGLGFNMYSPGTGMPGVNIGGGWRAGPW